MKPVLALLAVFLTTVGSAQERHPEFRGFVRLSLFDVKEPYTASPLWFACDFDGTSNVRGHLGYSNDFHVFQIDYQGSGTARLTLIPSTGEAVESETYLFESGFMNLDAGDILRLILSDEYAEFLDVELTSGNETRRMRFRIKGIHHELCTLSYACGVSWLGEASCSPSPTEALKPGSAFVGFDFTAVFMIQLYSERSLLSR